MDKQDILVEDLTPEQAIEKIKELEGKINILIHDFQVKWSNKVWINPKEPFMNNKAPVSIKPVFLYGENGFTHEDLNQLQEWEASRTL